MKVLITHKYLNIIASRTASVWLDPESPNSKLEPHRTPPPPPSDVCSI